MDDITDVKAVTKREIDGDHPASHYLVVEDPQKPSTWHLRVRDASGKLDHNLMGAAWAALHGGYRGNRYEGPQAAEALRKLKALYASEDMETPSTRAVVVKAVEGESTVTIGGYGVVFGGEDLQGETFTKDTDFWLDRLTRTPPVLYQHGRDAQMQKTVVGHATIADPDDVGLWVEAQLDLSDRYTEALTRLAREGKLGWSSGTAGHLAERRGKQITSWPVVEMSLTPTPAEPRTLGLVEIRSLTELEPALKALLPEDDGKSSVASEETGASTMAVAEMTTYMEVHMPENEKMAPAATERSMEDMIMAAVSKAMAASPALERLERLGPEETDRPEDKSFADFLVAVQRHDTKRIEHIYKADLAEGAGATGGYLVPPEYANEILRLAATRSAVRSQNPRVIPMSGNEWNVPAVNYSGGTEGVFPQLGGVRAYWTEEAGALTETEPTFETIRLVAHKLAGYTQASNEVRQDAGPTLEGLLRNLFAEAIALYEDWAFINGNGVGQPLGVLKAPCLLTEVAASSSFVLADIAAMLGKFLSRNNGGVWFMHPKVIEKLIVLADGSGGANNLIWMNNGQVQGAPPMSLMGKPIVWTDVMPILPAGSSASQIGGVLLADWSYYLIGDRAGLEIAYSEHYAFVNDQATWRFTKRLDGQPWLKQAVYLADGTNQVSPFVSLSGA